MSYDLQQKQDREMRGRGIKTNLFLACLLISLNMLSIIYKRALRYTFQIHNLNLNIIQA
uniref:Uncharacterized protein n=1 Tax=Rhizophora mucronata TaxID=61149 RepID=A0A2P2QFW2_RHIMU